MTTLDPTSTAAGRAEPSLRGRAITGAGGFHIRGRGWAPAVRSRTRVLGRTKGGLLGRSVNARGPKRPGPHDRGCMNQPGCG